MKMESVLEESGESQKEYFKKFNDAYKDYQEFRTEGNLALVNRYLAVIYSCFL